MTIEKEKTGCQRCGKCCEKGGPAFHTEDRFLIETGVIPLKYLFIIRKGAPANDNVKGGIVQAVSDIIKIKGEKGAWSCIFFDKKTKTCTIYTDRPLECRTLECWNPKNLEIIYEKNRLTRKDLLSGIEGLWELVQDHSRQCSFKIINQLLEDIRKNRTPESLEKIRFIISYDDQIRKLTIEKAKLDPDLLDFVFGIPLSEILFKLDKTILLPIINQQTNAISLI